MRAKEVERNELAQERDQLAKQLTEQADLLRKVQREAEVKESNLLAEFEVERSAWTDREAMLTSGFHEIEDIVDGKFLLFLRASDYVSGRLLIFRLARARARAHTNRRARAGSGLGSVGLIG